jgi:diaminohydroxyphosphoribosylaminopyrimidine deaminase / 5-amino-6-(5-phosphoribosylamino)uracil reductase
MDHNIFMWRCFELAKRGGKATRSNPNVGCVIVKDGKVIGEGYHKIFGGKHAEIEAIENVKDQTHLKGATIYVSLEPCCHTGKTPPCTDRIIEMSFSNVVISALDPNPLVAGQGVKILENHGINVVTGLLENEGKKVIKKFLANLQHRPYIILKSVQSKDGYIGAKNQQIWLSNEFTTTLSHQWRSETDGIMIGTQTAMNDNPSLTTRHWTGDHPTRIIWDRSLKIPSDAHIFDTIAPTILLNEVKEGTEQHITYVNTKDNSLQEVLTILYNMGIFSLIVEGGTSTLNTFYDAGLWDEARIITTPHILENKYSDLVKAIKIEGQEVSNLDINGDLLTTIDKK